MKQIVAELLITQNHSWFCGFSHILSVLLLLELSSWAELPSKGRAWEWEPVCRVSAVWDSNATCQPYNIQLFLFSLLRSVASCFFAFNQSAIRKNAYVWASLSKALKLLSAKNLASIQRMTLRICTGPVWSQCNPVRHGGAENCLWMSFSGCHSPLRGSASEGCRLCLCLSGF